LSFRNINAGTPEDGFNSCKDKLPGGPMYGWKAWYFDGTIVNSKEKRWEEAPAVNLLGVVLYHGKDNRTVLIGYDEFWIPGNAASKSGKRFPQERHAELFHIMKEDKWRP
jgi:hypothetical protein